jgi:glucokinase
VEAVLVNDMTALAHAVTGLGSSALKTLNPGVQLDGGVHAVIAPGTGLGEGYFVDHPVAPFACGTEGGHTGFAPATVLEEELLGWMRQQTGQVSCESLISGPGLARLYEFTVEQLGHPPCAEVNGQGGDRSPQIIAAALANSPVCLVVVELFLRLLGSEAGNLALKTYATGGVYLGGGILPRLLPRCSFAPLVEAFLAKGEMRSLMERIPLHLITSDTAIHLGAANWLSRRKQLPNGR